MLERAYRAEDERDQLRAEIDRLRAVVARVETWTHTFGSELRPRSADTYGEGVRDSKERVAKMLSNG
jgi:hypothetical protein